MRSWLCLLSFSLLGCAATLDRDVAVDDAALGRQGETIAIDVLANDDPTGQPRILGFTQPVGGRVTADVEPGILLYQAYEDFEGLDAFEYTVTVDGESRSSATVEVEVLRRLALRVSAPADGEVLSSGPVQVTSVVEGCFLGEEREYGCRIVGELDGEPLDPIVSETFALPDVDYGPHVLSLQLEGIGDFDLGGVARAQVAWRVADPTETVEGDVIVKSQADLDDLCRRALSVVVDGDLTILGPTDVQAATTISCLAEVGGSLSVEASGLVELGLPALTTVGADVRIIGNPQLLGVSMPGLSSIGETLFVQGNDELTSADFSSLTEIRDIEIDSIYLSDLALDELQTVSGRLAVLRGWFESFSLPRLNRAGQLELSVARLGQLRVILPVLQTVDGPFSVSGPSLDLRAPLLETAGTVRVEGDVGNRFSAERLESTRSLDVLGPFEIVDLSALVQVDESARFEDLWVTRLDLPLLQSVGGALEIADCGRALNISLPRLQFAEDLVLSNNTDLLTFTVPQLEVAHVDLLASPFLAMPGFPAFRSGSIDIDGIAGDGALVLPVVEQLSSLRVTNLPGVTSIDVGVEHLDVLSIVGNPLLQDIRVPLRSVDGGFAISSNASLTALDLGQLETVSLVDGSGLFIQRNPALGSLDLTALTRVPGPVRLQDNDALTAIDLGGLEQSGGIAIRQPLVVTLDLGSLVTPEVGCSSGCLELELPSLETLDLSSLEGVDRLEILGTRLQELSLPSLTSSTTLTVADNPLLQQVDVPLATTTRSVLIQDNSSLVGLEMPNVTLIQGSFFGGLTIQRNASLTTLSGLPVLAEVLGSVRVRENPVLLQTEAEAFVDALSVSGFVSVRDNLVVP